MLGASKPSAAKRASDSPRHDEEPLRIDDVAPAILHAHIPMYAAALTAAQSKLRDADEEVSQQNAQLADVKAQEATLLGAVYLRRKARDVVCSDRDLLSKQVAKRDWICQRHRDSLMTVIAGESSRVEGCVAFWKAALSGGRHVADELLAAALNPDAEDSPKGRIVACSQISLALDELSRSTAERLKMALEDDISQWMWLADAMERIEALRAKMSEVSGSLDLAEKRRAVATQAVNDAIRKQDQNTQRIDEYEEEKALGQQRHRKEVVESVGTRRARLERQHRAKEADAIWHSGRAERPVVAQVTIHDGVR